MPTIKQRVLPMGQKEIEQLVLDYQHGDLAYELIEIFKPLIYKYINILKYQRINFDDAKSRQFISLFVSDSYTRNCLKRKNPSLDAKKHVYDLLSMLNHALYCYESDDLFNEAVVVLLTMARNYKQQGKSFLGYINKSFPFAFYRAIIQLVRDPSVFSRNYNLSLETIDDNTSQMLKLSENPYDRINEDFSFIKGQTDSPFALLTPLDRLILIKRYVDGLTIKEIAVELGYATSTIWEHIRKSEGTLYHAVIGGGLSADSQNL
ncbi:RNA polymerase sigma factor [Neomoorella thermoacetica]|nr:sigma factor-like helix-turn-helix DNA-binding protein [Moorella thermoacetica]